MKNSELMLSPLKPALLINNHINGFKKYKYEDYLIEFINNSKFLYDHGNSIFLPIENQNHGEADATNGEYDIDFKILSEPNDIYAKKILGQKIFIDDNKACLYGYNKTNITNIEYLNVFKVFANYDRYITDSNIYNDTRIVKAMNIMEKIICKDKNLLILLPFELFYDDEETDIKTAKRIIKEISNGLSSIYLVRSKRTNKDLYFVFLSNRKMIFVSFDGEKPILYDYLSIDKSKLFNELYAISYPLIDL